jgi:hypothetical protein
MTQMIHLIFTGQKHLSQDLAFFKEQMDHLDQLGLKVTKETLVLLDLLALRAQGVILVNKDKRVILVLQVL